ncbi:glucose 1-dehydrogenase [Candidatus Micrarchaeota archaeon]|nr:glucose 1-dehydrogenase [Candidatus Micrarchaeota archaeon]
MRAVGMFRVRKGIHAFTAPKPSITSPNHVLVRILETGVDGTDFGILKSNIPDIAKDRDRLILGHEVLGMVEAHGKEVQGFRKGDFVTATVRRGCGICAPCLHNQSDMCLTGLYTERGIHKTDGFLTEYFVDESQYLLKIPRELAQFGVFVEPLSIAEKAVEQIRHIQSRLPWACGHKKHGFDQPGWGHCKTALVIGAGPLGFLATALLRLEDVDVYVVEIVPEDHYKVEMIKKLGAKYIDARGKTPEEIVHLCCSLSTLDIIFEASGASKLALSLIPLMSRSSIYLMTGIPRGIKMEELDSHSILRQIVRHNIVIVGSVNSNLRHFQQALHDIPRINARFKGILNEAITHRFPLAKAEKAFEVQDEKQLKIVVEVHPLESHKR